MYFRHFLKITKEKRKNDKKLPEVFEDIPKITQRLQNIFKRYQKPWLKCCLFFFTLASFSVDYSVQSCPN